MSDVALHFYEAAMCDMKGKKKDKVKKHVLVTNTDYSFVSS